jgi:hypothetical protein
MKIYEIVAEKYYPVEEDRLDEFVPIIAGLSIGGVISAITVVLAAMSFADIIKFIGKYNEDPSKISQDEWNDLFIDVMLLAIPGVAKLGRGVVVKMLPKKIVSKGGKWLNAKVSDLWKKKNPKFNQEYRAKLKQAKIDYPKSQLAQRTARIKFKAGQKVKEIGSAYNWVVSLGGTVYYIQDYYENIGLLEEEWREWVESTKNNTPLKMPNRFADMSYSDAEAKFDSERNTLLGKASLGVITSSGFALKLLNTVTGLGLKGSVALFKGGGVVSGGAGTVAFGLMNGIGRLMAGIVGNTATGAVGKTALMTWLETTSEGKAFQQSVVIQMLYSGIGWVTDKILQGLRAGYEYLQKLAKKLGINLPDLSNKLKPGGGSQKPDKELKDKADQAEKERQSKTVNVGDITVTDYDGYLLNNPVELQAPDVLNSIKIAKIDGKPHPLKGIPLKPGVDYSQVFKALGPQSSWV